MNLILLKILFLCRGSPRITTYTSNFIHHIVCSLTHSPIMFCYEELKVMFYIALAIPKLTVFKLDTCVVSNKATLDLIHTRIGVMISLIVDPFLVTTFC